MFSYMMLGTNDLPRAIEFYDPLMALLGHPKLRNCMPSPCNSADVTKALPVTAHNMATAFTAPTSAIPTAISWRLFIMRRQLEWLLRKCLFQAVMRHSGRPTSPS